MKRNMKKRSWKEKYIIIASSFRKRTVIMNDYENDKYITGGAAKGRLCPHQSRDLY